MEDTKREMTVREFASLGGKQRKKNLSAKRRSEIARLAVMARWRKHKKKGAAKTEDDGRGAVQARERRE